MIAPRMMEEQAAGELGRVLEAAVANGLLRKDADNLRQWFFEQSAEIERLKGENERLARHHAGRCEERNALQQEANANLERAERAEVRLKQSQEEAAALGVGFALLVRTIGQFAHAEACEAEDTYDADEVDGCQCALALLPDALAVLKAHNPSAALVEQHAKALVRARNEGLEKAAVGIGDLVAQWHRVKDTRKWNTSSIRTYLEERIRAMKEAEQ